MGARKNLLEDGILFNIAQDHPETTPSNQCRFDVGIVVAHDYFIEEPVKEGTIFGGKYAVYEVKHTTQDIANAYVAIFAALQSKEYEHNGHPIVEKYRGENEMCEICVPIRCSIEI
ncbi:MAG: GyrI-like domain-containing protein [Bacilli bacterium]